ncbi:MAG TPA: high-potential iron-sulfur protein [Verrucomicrobiae bacterium]|jgi:hypothetical protein|nr:high-potential iron-sulfur protein [Verrucomicrobiae bacterium]
MSQEPITRKQILSGLVLLPALAIALRSNAQAAGSSKSSVKYQGEPKDGHQCSGCRFFRAGHNPEATGSCTVVAGGISPKGWCEVWSKK